MYHSSCNVGVVYSSSMTAGRQGGVVEVERRWRATLGELLGLTRQSLGILIAACHMVILRKAKRELREAPAFPPE